MPRFLAVGAIVLAALLVTSLALANTELSADLLDSDVDKTEYSPGDAMQITAVLSAVETTFDEEGNFVAEKVLAVAGRRVVRVKIDFPGQGSQYFNLLSGRQKMKVVPALPDRVQKADGKVTFYLMPGKDKNTPQDGEVRVKVGKVITVLEVEQHEVEFTVVRPTR